MSRLWVRIPQTPDSPKTFFYFFLNFFLFNYVTVLFRYYHTPKKTICRWKLRPNCKGQFMRVWYLLHMRTAKGEMSLHIRAISPQPLLFVLKKKRSRWRFSPNFGLFKAVVLLLWIHYLMFPHWVVRLRVWSLFRYALLSVLSCFAIILSRKRDHDSLLSLSSYDWFSVSVLHGSMGLSEMYNCGTSWSYSLTFYKSIHLSSVLIA